MKLKINKNKIILTITAIAIAGFSIYSAVAGIFKPNVSPSGNLTSGLINYWTMDGQDINWGANTITDRGLGGNNGTLTNMLPASDPKAGKIGQGLYFDGVNNYINMGDVDNFEVNSPISFSFWVKFEGLTGGRIIGKWASGCDNGWNIVVVNSKVQIGFDGSFGADCGQPSFAESTQPSLGVWYHYVITYDGSKSLTGVKIYRDASEGTSIVNADDFPDSILSDYPLYIGARSRTPADNFFNKGILDEFRIYNRVLTPSEITELYNQGEKNLAKINTSQINKLTSGLVGYWTMDGNYVDWAAGDGKEIRDASGNGYHADATSITSADARPGKIGQALNYNGVNNYINLGDQAAFDFGTGNFTASLWFKTDLGQGNCLLCKCDNSGTCGDGVSIYLNPTGTRIYYWLVGGSEIFFPGAIYSDNAWHHVLVTREGINTGQTKLYFDGLQKDPSQSFSDSRSLSNAQPLAIGSDSDGNEAFFKGNIDEVRIYNRALSASEITELYNQGAKNLLKVNMPQTNLIPQGLVGYWPMDGNYVDWAAGDGKEIRDASGNGYHADATSMSLADARPGKIGQAMQIGADHFADGITTPLSSLTNTFTVSMWIYEDGQNNVAQTLFSGAAADGAFGVDTIPAGQHKLNYIVGLANHTGNTVITPNTWHHAVLTSNAGEYDMYLDGVDDFTGTGSGGGIFSNSPVIGNYLGYDSPFSGKIDEVRYYNRALSASEVMELYQAGSSR